MSQLKIQAPTYTQIPNAVLDSMNRFTECELAVLLAICRMTFGWHKESARLTAPDLVKITGRSHGGVVAAIKSLDERFIIEKNPSPYGNEYSVVVQPLDDGSPTTGRPHVQPLDDPIKERKDLKKGSCEESELTKQRKSEVAEFTKRWCEEFPTYNDGEKYIHQGAKDGVAAKALLGNGVPVDVAIGTAIDAWQNKTLFNCRHSVSISGFKSRYNEIRAELNGLPKRTPLDEASRAKLARIGKLFKRPTGSFHSDSEWEAFRIAGPILDDDLRKVETYYNADIPNGDIRRKSMLTLLQNWVGELDKARRFKPRPDYNL